MSRVLVTGAQGFVGRHAARAAARAGHVVIGIGRGEWDEQDWRDWGLVDWHTGEISTEILSNYGGEPDWIIHCAGSGSVGFSIAHPALDFASTVAGTMNVLEYARRHAPDTRLVLPSSAAVYGECLSLPIRVENVGKPRSPYGLHKKMSEELCEYYSRSYGLKVAIVRLFSVYGKGLRKQLLWDACLKIASGSARFSGTGEETRDWIHVEDAARLLLLAAERADANCSVVNGASGKPHTIREIIKYLCQGFAGEVSPDFDGVQRPGDPLHFEACIDEAKAWGWEPREDLITQIQAYVEWFKGGGAA